MNIPCDQLTDIFLNVIPVLPPQQLTRVVHFGQRRLLRDFIVLLPPEISLHILSLLPVHDLLRASLVSKSWYRLVNENGLWRSAYMGQGWRVHMRAVLDRMRSELPPEHAKYGLQFPVRTNNVEAAGTSRPSHLPLNGPTDATPSIPDGGVPPELELPNEGMAPWKYLYKQRYHLYDNMTHQRAVRHSFLGHTEGIYCIQADTNKLISGSRDDTVRVWDIDTHTTRHVLPGHRGSVLCLEYNNNHLVTGSSDRTIRVWSVPPSHSTFGEAEDNDETYRTICELNGHAEAVLNLRMDSSQARIVSCSKDTSIRLWDWNRGECIRTLSGHSAAVNAVQLRDDIVVSASGDRTLRVWDIRMRTGTPPLDGRPPRLFDDNAAGSDGFITSLEGHSRGIACVAFDGTYVVSGSSDQTIRVWDLRCTSDRKMAVRSPEVTGPQAMNLANQPRIASSACLRVIAGHTDLVRTVQFSANDDMLISGSYDKSLKLWSFSSGSLRCSMQLSERIFNVQWVPGTVYAASQDRELIAYDFSSDVDLIGMNP